MLSVMSKAPGLSVAKAIKQLGPLGLFRGGSARMVHVSSYVIAQFLIYDSIKRFCGIPVAGQSRLEGCVFSRHEGGLVPCLARDLPCLLASFLTIGVNVV